MASSKLQQYLCIRLSFGAQVVVIPSCFCRFGVENALVAGIPNETSTGVRSSEHSEP